MILLFLKVLVVLVLPLSIYQSNSIVPHNMAVLNTIGAITAFLSLTTGVCVYLLPSSRVSTSIYALLFFNNINILIAILEIILGIHIKHIKENYIILSKKYKGREWDGVMAFLLKPLSIEDLFSAKVWSLMWSAYSLYDPSYQNHESFGFFIDFGNGLSTLFPTMLISYALVYPEQMPQFFVGCLGLAMYWQKAYGTIIYLLSFVYNKRYEGKPLPVVLSFVGTVNGIWIFFPLIGIKECVTMIRDSKL